MSDLTEPAVPVGFDYRTAVLHLREHCSYDAIASWCGYSTPSAVSKILGGAIPSHVQGEALYALYVEIIGKKPPCSKEQATGTAKISLSVCKIPP